MGCWRPMRLSGSRVVVVEGGLMKQHHVGWLIILALAGCGGGGSGSSQGAATAVSAASADTPVSGITTSATTAAPGSAVTASPLATQTSTSTNTGDASTTSGGTGVSSTIGPWPVSQLLARGLSQAFGVRAITASTFNQTAALDAIGGVTDGQRGNTWMTWSWRIVGGQLVVDKYQVFGAAEVSSCEATGVVLPVSARIGDSGVALQCQQTVLSGGKSAAQPLTVRWSVLASNVPGAVLVCLSYYGCVRGDISANLDTSHAPWDAADGATSVSAGQVGAVLPTPMTTAWSLRNMVQNIREGQVFYLPVYQRWVPGATAPVWVNGVIKVTGREYPDGAKGLEFGDARIVFSFRIRLSHFGIAQWSIRDGNGSFDEATEAIQTSMAGGFRDPGLLDGLTGGAIFSAVLPPIPASRSVSLQTEFSVQADEVKACLNAARVSPVSANTWSFCWSHEPSEVLFADSRGRAGQEIYATSQAFLLR